jgi:hypothetical protein
MALMVFVEATIEIIEDISRRDIPVVDVQDLMARFTMDAASEFLFGKCLDTLQGRRPIAGQARVGVKGSAYANVSEDSFGDFATGKVSDLSRGDDNLSLSVRLAFESAQVFLSLRSAKGQLWPLFELFKDKSAPHMRVIRDFLDQVISKAKEERKPREETTQTDTKAMYGDEEPTTLLGELMNSIDGAYPSPAACSVTEMVQMYLILPKNRFCYAAG